MYYVMFPINKYLQYIYDVYNINEICKFRKIAADVKFN